MPTPYQILGAKIRAAEEAYIKKHRRPYTAGPLAMPRKDVYEYLSSILGQQHQEGYLVPSRKDTYKYLSKLFGMPTHEVSYFFTYSRFCEHPWSAGACDDCPD